MGFHRLLAMETHSDGVTADFKAWTEASSLLAMRTGELLATSWTTQFLLWVAVIAAIYLLVLDRTNWRTNFLTSLLVPYLYINLPDFIFYFFNEGFGKWIAFFAVIVKLFFPRHYPDWLELPAALILLAVVSPYTLAGPARHSLIAILISLAIGIFLGYEHINAAGGFRAAFAEKKGIPVTIGIIVLALAPFFELLSFFSLF